MLEIIRGNFLYEEWWFFIEASGHVRPADPRPPPTGRVNSVGFTPPLPTTLGEEARVLNFFGRRSKKI